MHDSSDVHSVVLTAAGNMFTLRFTSAAAGRLFSNAHQALSSVARLTGQSKGQIALLHLRPVNTVDGKVIPYVRQ